MYTFVNILVFASFNQGVGATWSAIFTRDGAECLWMIPGTYQETAHA